MDQHKLMVYVVDDHSSTRRSLKRLLESDRHDVGTFTMAEELLEKQPLKPGCLVLDVRLPGLDGFELYDRLSASGNPSPVILMMAHFDETMKNRAVAMGALGYLEKPFVNDTLHKMIDEAFNKSGTDADQI